VCSSSVSPQISAPHCLWRYAVLGKFWGGRTFESLYGPVPYSAMDGQTVPSWMAWAAGLSVEQCVVACCHASSQPLKSVGHSNCFELPSLIVLTSHSTLPMWLLLLDLWTPPAKHLFLSLKTVAFCHNKFVWIFSVLADHYAPTPWIIFFISTLLKGIQVLSPFTMW